MKYKIWNKTDDLITPVGTVKTKEDIFAEAPAAKFLDYIIADQAVNMAVFLQYDMYKNQYEERGLDFTGKSQQEILDMISDYEENPPIVEGDPSAEERTAAALEFIALSNVPADSVVE